MTKISICTFNVENLFGRYKVFGFMPADQFRKEAVTAEELEEKGGFLPGQKFAPKNSFEIFDKEIWRQLTVQALKGNTTNYPDIACLQEVESMRVLRYFNENSNYLSKAYQYVLLIDSHDPRLIDIGVLSKYPIIDVKTHIDDLNDEGTEYLFSRDCLEVTFDIKGTPLTLFVNHFKSKFSSGATKEEKEADLFKSGKKRKAQAERVAEIVKERFKGQSFNNRAFAVLGDFNDTPDSEYVTAVTKDLGLENVIDRIPDKTNRWTHWWESKNLVSQIDHILISPRLSNDSLKEPYLERRGISTKRKYSYLALQGDKKGDKINLDEIERFEGVSDKFDASDHCPVHFEIKL